MPAPGATSSPAAILSKCDLDLAGEARWFFRQRFRVAGTGLALGIAFVALGVIEVGVRASSGFSTTYLIAVLLVVLGLAVVGVCLYSGLLNPVTRIRANSGGIAFERRWGRPLAWKWKDPAFRIDIDERTDDPAGSPESHRHHFFEGPGPIYGNLTPSTIGPLIDVARTYNAPVSTKQLELKERGEIYLVQRIRIRPAPAR